MTARARVKEEDYEQYRSNLKKEAELMKLRLKGRWVWKTFYPITENSGELPRGSVVYHRDKENGTMIVSKEIDHKEQVHYIKFPPFVGGVPRVTFSQQRKARWYGGGVTGDQETPTENNNGGGT